MNFTTFKLITDSITHDHIQFKCSAYVCAYGFNCVIQLDLPCLDLSFPLGTYFHYLCISFDVILIDVFFFLGK